MFLDSVFRFNREVVGISRFSPQFLVGSEAEWLEGVLKEEADEFTKATNTVDQVDALIDSVIFAIGGLARLGLSPSQARDCFSAVMAANFEKKAGQKAGRIFEGVKDAVKPDDWVGPEARIHSILYYTGDL
jgi:predicted HAD superfamily Cof-like phosphohydrolase